jgi:hypothetical protein
MPHVVPVLRLYPASGEVSAPNPYVIHTVLQIMKLDRSTKPKDIVKAISHEYNQSINYSAATVSLEQLLGRRLMSREQFRQPGLLLETVRQADPYAYIKLDIDPNTFAGELADVRHHAKERCSIWKQTGHYAPRCRKAHS